MGSVKSCRMVAGTLYTYPDNFRAQKALIAAKYSGADVKVAQDFVFGETNKSADFLKKFPLGKVPAFEGSDGTVLTESNAIAFYVANDELRGGSGAEARAAVVQWMCWVDSDVLPAACTWVFPTMGIMQYNKNQTDRAKEDVKSALEYLNTHLLSKTFLVGERVSLADIAVCCTMLSFFKSVLDPAFRKPYINVTRWFTTVINQPNVKAVLGDVVLCSKMAEFDSKKWAEFQAKAKRRKRMPLLICPLLRRRKIPLMSFLTVQNSTWRSGRDFIPIMMRMIQSNGFGSTLMQKIILFGGQTISITMNLQWCSCPVISLEVCSRD